MILHRIKIVDAQGKFLRYATTKEMLTLTINADGKVVQIGYWLPMECTTPIIPYTGGTGLIYGWKDMSPTHIVEWGIMTSDKHGKRIPIYSGDIYVDWNTGFLENKHTRPAVFSIYNMEHALDEMFPMIEVIGNINENPEYLNLSIRSTTCTCQP